MTEGHVHKKRRLSPECGEEELQITSSNGLDMEVNTSPDGETKTVLPESKSTKSKHLNVLPYDKVSKSQEAIAKTGIIYLSRIPPRLSPTKVRQLLSPYGCPILRIFLAPESPAVYNRRVKSGGSKKKQYTEGWIEFEDKRVAKKVATMLNAQRIGAQKGDFLYDDLWCLKYLPKFKWNHLTQQIGNRFFEASILTTLAYQNASRAEKLRNEIAQEKRENLAFIRNAERNKMIESMQRKRQGRGRETTRGDDPTIRRNFSQNSVIENATRGTRTHEEVLKKVFE